VNDSISKSQILKTPFKVQAKNQVQEVVLRHP